MANAGRLQQATTVNASAFIRSLVARVARSASLRDTTRRTRVRHTRIAAVRCPAAARRHRPMLAGHCLPWRSAIRTLTLNVSCSAVRSTV